MIRIFLSFLFFCICLSAYAQPNLYVSNGISDFVRWPLYELGNNVYFLSRTNDSVNGMGINRYFITSVDKHAYTIKRSVQILTDTAFNQYESLQYFAVSYSFNPSTNKFNFFFVTDVDSSSFAPSPLKQYPKTISFMQLDTNLNVSVARKDILHFYGADRYAMYGLSLSLPVNGNNTLLNYDVRDTVITDHVISSAAKILVVNDTGKLLEHKFLGWEPVGDDTYFAVHFSNGDLYRSYNNTYAAMGQFDDSISVGLPLMLMLDSNFNLTDTFDHFTNLSGTLTSPGKFVLSFGGMRENYIFLPTGSLISSGLGAYKDSSDQKVYYYYGVGKGNLSTGYRPGKIYFPPKSDTGDNFHTATPAFIPTVYNGFDNTVYTFSSTKSHYDGYYCMNGQPSLGQLAAIDTNLEEKWVKYIHPRSGHCIESLLIASTDGRSGVLVSGWETDLSDPYNESLWHAFIYHIDSNTRLGVNNPESPVMITDQFTLYPNPAAEQLFIENVLGTGYSYSIINSIGQAVLSGRGQGSKMSVAVGNLPSGIYMVCIQSAGGKRFSLRFLKE